jgi:hypothetical protein
MVCKYSTNINNLWEGIASGPYATNDDCLSACFTTQPPVILDCLDSYTLDPTIHGGTCGNFSYLDTSIYAYKGDLIKINANGSIRYHPDRPFISPDGDDTVQRVPEFADPPCITPSINYEPILAKIGNSIIPIGSDVSIVAPEDGLLQFFIIDSPLSDNAGSYNIQASNLTSYRWFDGDDKLDEVSIISSVASGGAIIRTTLQAVGCSKAALPARFQLPNDALYSFAPTAGSVTFTFSDPCKDLLLYIGSLGELSTAASLSFNVPFEIISDSVDSTADCNGETPTILTSFGLTVSGNQGFGIIKFPGFHKQITVDCSLNIDYTFLRWGLLGSSQCSWNIVTASPYARLSYWPYPQTPLERTYEAPYAASEYHIIFDIWGFPDRLQIYSEDDSGSRSLLFDRNVLTGTYPDGTPADGCSTALDFCHGPGPKALSEKFMKPEGVQKLVVIQSTQQSSGLSGQYLSIKASDNLLKNSTLTPRTFIGSDCYIRIPETELIHWKAMNDLDICKVTVFQSAPSRTPPYKDYEYKLDLYGTSSSSSIGSIEQDVVLQPDTEHVLYFDLLSNLSGSPTDAKRIYVDVTETVSGSSVFSTVVDFQDYFQPNVFSAIATRQRLTFTTNATQYYTVKFSSDDISGNYGGVLVRPYLRPLNLEPVRDKTVDITNFSQDGNGRLNLTYSVYDYDSTTGTVVKIQKLIQPTNGTPYYSTVYTTVSDENGFTNLSDTLWNPNNEYESFRAIVFNRQGHASVSNTIAGGIPFYTRDLTYGSNIFLAVTPNVYSSTDGSSWNRNLSSNWNILDDKIKLVGSEFFAFSSSGYKTALSPYDGTSWDASRFFGNVTLVGNVTSVTDVAYGGGKYIAVSSSNNEYAISSDRINWTRQLFPFVGAGIEPYWNSIAYGGLVFIAVARYWSSTRPKAVAISTDQGSTWTYITSLFPSSFAPTTVFFADSKFIIFGGGSVYYSEDFGQTWHFISLVSVGNLHKVAYGNGNFVFNERNRNLITIVNNFSGGSQGNTFQVSLPALPTNSLWDGIASDGHNNFVTVATFSNIAARSIDGGFTWTQHVI